MFKVDIILYMRSDGKYEAFVDAYDKTIGGVSGVSDSPEFALIDLGQTLSKRGICLEEFKEFNEENS